MNWFLRLAVMSILAGFILAARPSSAATLPTGFQETLVAGGLTSPTAMAFAPDGRIFVCQQGGSLRVIKNGTLLATPFVTVTTDSLGERGLLGVAFDPNFEVNQFVYVYYTVPTSTRHNRVSRFTAQGDVAAPASETILLELDDLSATNHNGGAIHFGLDGKLYIAVGENAVQSNAQTLTNLLGKVLRIDSDGTIPADNPFFGGTTGKNRAIWAYGLRNPFTFAFHKTSGRMFVNDVGQSAFEEINDGIAGSNYGWPVYEGNDGGDPLYRDPLFEYTHGSGTSTGCAIVGAAFYDATTQAFPADYANDYFFADLCSGWIRRYDPVSGAVDLFATGVNTPVDLAVQPDGSLYYLARGGGELFRVTYPPAPLPSISVSDASVVEGASGTTEATFIVLLSQPSTLTVTVPHATANGTASAGADYATASDTMTFLPGDVSEPVTVVVFGDVDVEGSETFFVNLGVPSNATIDDGQGLGTILDDDPAPPASLAHFVMLGEVRETTVSAGTPTQWFKVRLVAGRSYAVAAWAPATDPSESPVDLSVTWFLDDGVTVAAGADTAASEPLPEAGGHVGGAASIIPTAAQCVAATGCTYRLRVQATGAAAPYAVNLSVLETTLTSPYWQVATFAGYDAALEIRNSASNSVPVVLTVYNSAGSPACSSSFSLPAHGMTTFGLSGASPGCGVGSGFGSAHLAFQGPPGSITANITTFNATSGLSFDAPFRPRNTWTSLH